MNIKAIKNMRNMQILAKMWYLCDTETLLLLSVEWTEISIRSQSLSAVLYLVSPDTKQTGWAYSPKVVTSGITWNSIPNRYFALYIFGKDAISAKPIDELLSPSYLGSLSCIYSNDSDMSRFTSALHYQLPIEKSMDIVFTCQMKIALDNNDFNVINQLAKSNSTFVMD